MRGVDDGNVVAVLGVEEKLASVVDVEVEAGIIEDAVVLLREVARATRDGRGEVDDVEPFERVGQGRAG